MPAKQFKDFNKEAKDLLTKNYPVPGTWKIETKGKGADRDIILSTTADYAEKAKNVNVDVEFNLMKEYKLKTKTNITADGKIKPKVTYDAAPHKVEATLMGLSADADFEVTYEGELAGAVVYDRLTKKEAELQASYPFGALSVGAGVAYGFAKGTISWGAGARYADKNVTASVSTKDLRTFSTGVYAPLIVSGYALKLAAQVDCGEKLFKCLAGFEAPIDCLAVFPKKSALRVRFDHSLNSNVSLILKLAQNWTATLSVAVTDVTKFGVQLTLE